VLRAFARVRARHPKAALFLMGPVASDELRPFERDPQAARDQGIYLYLTYASYDLMLMAMEAVDVGINLRYPTAGETSGTLSMLLGQGKPTLVSDVGSFSEYPDACCPKTPVNDQEEDILVQHLLALMEDRRLYRQSVQAAYAYSQDKTWAHCAQRYLEFIESLLSSNQ
jgi:glycosyltransferase involved in cell wall biosynthesis